MSMNAPAWRMFLILGGLALFAIVAQPVQAGISAGTNSFRRPLQGGAAMSVQAITAGDSDSSQIPLFVSQVDAQSAQGGLIVRSNDWLYYTPPASSPGTDSFAYVISNLQGDTATGAVSIVADAHFAPTNYLHFSLMTNAGYQLQFFGDAGPYFIQASTNLQTWLNVGARLAWPTGYFNFTMATNAAFGGTHFFRAASGASAPMITNYQATGTANVQVDFALGTEGGAGSPFPATVLTLPAQGFLMQDDGTQISNVPTAVTSTNGSLHYFGPVNGYGPNFGSFQYKITRPSDGLDSVPAAFRFSLSADEPTITTPVPNVPENSNAVIQLTAADPDLRYASNHLRFEIVFSTTHGALYQVKPDGTPDFSVRIADGAWVSNVDNLVDYVPPALQYGSPFESYGGRV